MMALAGLIAGAWWWMSEKMPRSSSVVASGQDLASNQAPVATSTSAPNPAFEKLKGRWLRPDGGYVIEVRGIFSDGKLDAGYFNPQPINVAKAMAILDEGKVKVFIELRDVNYPGSTYSLAYDPTTDQLWGNYFQAAMGQNYEVEFIRQQ
jgi:hypothetical protein